MPEDADPGVWIMSEGKVSNKPTVQKSNGRNLTKFGPICDAYLQGQLDKAESTLEGERIHIRHFKKVFGESVRLADINLHDVEQYVQRRNRQRYRGKRISGKTIRKELVTFQQVWGWSRERGYVTQDCPIYNQNRRWAVSIPKPTERLKFQTWNQIERKLKRGGLTKAQTQELWGSLFLDEDQIAGLLKYVKDQDTYPFIYPMFVFAAYTGARRGEIRRSHIDDFDFDQDQVMIRERKRRKDMDQTFRFVPMHPRLREVMQEWFEQHPGGSFTIVPPLKMQRRKTRTEFCEITVDEARHHFKHTLSDSKWKVLRGFHVLRHSFGSNLARSGEVSRDTIAEWMGHTTEEMKTLYQHLFPQDGQSKISVLK